MLTLTEKDKQRYWEKVEVRGLDECWPWMGGRNKKGYGVMGFAGKNRKHRTHNAHRIGLMIRLGSLPDEIHALHICDCAFCQNPIHIFPGTNLENIADKMEKGRHRAPIGSEHKWAKLNDDIVRLMRRLHANGKVSISSLAARFGVSIPTARKAIVGKTWKHVSE